MSTDTFKTFCQICRAECGMIAHLSNGKVTRVEGDPDDAWSRGKLCVKGRSSPQIIYAEDRLRHPLLREVRSEPFRRASWQEAIDFIADRMQGIKEKHGAQAIAFYRGTTAKVVDNAVLTRLARLYGSPNVTGTWSVCVGPKILAYDATFGRPPMPWCDLAHARYIMLWGGAPSATYLHRYHGINADIGAARKSGARLTVVDPRRTPLARLADSYLQITPGTDIALALAMINHIIAKGLYDEMFVASYTLGFDRLAEHVSPYTPRWAEGITDISAALIEEVATDLAVIKPASLDRRQGVQHCSHATQTCRALAILVAITGNVDVEGGLMMTPYRRLRSLPVPADLPKSGKSFWEEGFPLARDASGYLPQAILSEDPYPLKAMFAIEGNPISCFPNTGKTRKALSALDLVVVNDLFRNDATEFADVVLPACTFLEKGEISVQSQRTDYPVRTRLPVVEPLKETLPEWKWLSMLGRRLGFQEFFPFESDRQVIDAVLEAAGWDACEPAIPTSYGEVLQSGFSTPSGKIELYSRSFEEHGYDPLPTVPLDWPEDGEFPYYLITGARVPQFYHSQHRNIARLRRAHPEPLAEISWRVAREVGVEDWEEVTIVTRVGSASFRAKVADVMHPLTVSVPHGWPGSQNANWLVDDLPVDPVAATPPYRDMRCRVEKTVRDRLSHE